MKKSFQKSLIAASVGAVMFAAVGTASANSLLFPYFTTASGAQSVLSLSTNSAATGASLAAGTSRERLHYVYNYTNTATPTAPNNSCVHFDGFGSMSANDVLQHSIAGTGAGGFGKAVGADGSTPFYLPLAGTTGFLTVTTATGAAAVVTGDMVIVDPSTGLAASYAGITNGITNTAGAGGTGNSSEGDFSLIQDKSFDISTFGSGIASTTFYTLVMGNMNAAIQANRNWGGAASISNNGLVFDNDENPLSGTVNKRVNCVGTLTAADFQTAAQAAAVGPNGGLTHVTATMLPVNLVPSDGTPPVGDASTGLVIFKLQAVQAAVGAPFSGRTFAHRMFANNTTTTVTNANTTTTTTPGGTTTPVGP